jgi:DNA-binding transcriptional LysR family regulator
MLTFNLEIFAAMCRPARKTGFRGGCECLPSGLGERGSAMQTDPINLRHFHALSVVLATGNLSAAATELALSQPALSQAIQKLERRFGCSLFERHPIGLRANRYAEALSVRLRRAMTLMSVACRRLAGGDAMRGKVMQRHLTTSMLKALIAVEETGDLSQAAKMLGIAKPTLHRTMSRLELVAGQTLFQRTGQRSGLTDVARALAINASLAFYEMQMAHFDLVSARGQIAGSIVIGSLPMPRGFIVPEAISAFVRLYPQIDVSVHDGSYQTLLEALLFGKIDMVVGALRKPIPQKTIAIPLFEDRLSILARSDHPLARKRNVVAEDLPAYKWVVPNIGTPARKIFNSLFVDVGLKVPENVIACGSYAIVRRLLLNDDHLALISAKRALEDIASGVIRSLNFTMHDQPSTIAVLTRRDFLPTLPQSEMIEAIKRVCGERS